MNIGNIRQTVTRFKGGTSRRGKSVYITIWNNRKTEWESWMFLEDFKFFGGKLGILICLHKHMETTQKQRRMSVQSKDSRTGC